MDLILCNFLISSFLSCEWQERNGTGTSRACKFDEESMPVMYPKVSLTKEF